MKSHEMSKVIIIHPEGNMNVSIKLNSNPFKSCQNISLVNANVNLIVALKAKSDHLKILEFILWGV